MLRCPHIDFEFVEAKAMTDRQLSWRNRLQVVLNPEPLTGPDSMQYDEREIKDHII